MNTSLSDLRASVTANDWDRSRTIVMSIICFMDIDNLRYTMNKLIYIYSLEFFYFPVQENVPLINIDIDNIEKLKSNLEPLLGQPGMSNFISSLKNYIYIYNINSCTDEFSDIYTSAII